MKRNLNRNFKTSQSGIAYDLYRSFSFIYLFNFHVWSFNLPKFESMIRIPEIFVSTLLTRNLYMSLNSYLAIKYKNIYFRFADLVKKHSDELENQKELNAMVRKQVTLLEEQSARQK